MCYLGDEDSVDVWIVDKVLEDLHTLILSCLTINEVSERREGGERGDRGRKRGGRREERREEGVEEEGKEDTVLNSHFIAE